MNYFENISRKTINDHYVNVCITKIDDFPHCSTIYDIAKKCQSITEISTIPADNSITFTWCLVNGLLDGYDFGDKEFESISLSKINKNIKFVRDIAKSSGLDFQLSTRLKNNTLTKETDMLFVHTDYTFDFLNDILIQNSNLVRKYIIVHDKNFIRATSKDIFSISDNETLYIVKDVVTSFLNTNSGWSLVKNFNMNFGMFVLEKLEI